MASQLQLRGGTTAEHGSFTGAIRELTVDTTLKALRLHDGVTAGGTVIAGLSDVQALITTLSNATQLSFTAETATRTAAVTNLTALINSATNDRVTEDNQIKADFAAGDVATLASANTYTDTSLAAGDVTTLASANTYTDTAVNNLLGGAPDLLNTLNELAAAIGDDSNFVTTLTASVSAEATTRSAAVTAIQTRLNSLETDTTSATAVAAVQAAVDLRATIENPTFTTRINSPEFHSAGGHLKFKGATNDIVFYPNNIETLQITRNSSTGHPTFTANGGSGEFKFNQSVDLADGFKVGGVAITADGAEINYLDGVTSNIQTQLDAEAAARAAADTANLATAQAFATAAVADVIDASPAALDTLNEIAAAIGDDASFITTVTNNIATVQADVDANETAANTAVASQNTAMLAAVAVVQADVNQNETDCDAAIAAVQADVNSNETAINASLATETADRIAGDAATLSTAQSYADTAVSNLINAAPGALDTLNELAEAINDDANFATTVTNSIAVVQADVNANETAINSSLSTETSARTSADSALSARLDTAEGKSSYTDPTTQTLLTAEASTRSSADTALSARLDTAEAKTSYSDPTTQTLLTAETTTRAAAVITLQSNIDTITTARTVDEERHLQAGLATGYLYVSNFSGG